MTDPTLADLVAEACASPDTHFPGWRNMVGRGRHVVVATHRFGEDLKLATRVVLDPDFLAIAAAIVAEPPTFFLRALPTVRSPFDYLWIEWDEGERFRALGESTREGPALRCGFLLRRVDDNQPLYQSWGVVLSSRHTVSPPAKRDILQLYSGFIFSAGEPLWTGQLGDRQLVPLCRGLLSATDLQIALEILRGDTTHNGSHALGIDWCQRFAAARERESLVSLSRQFCYSGGPWAAYYLAISRGTEHVVPLWRGGQMDGDTPLGLLMGRQLHADLRWLLAILILWNTLEVELGHALRVSTQPRRVGVKKLRWLEHRTIRVKLPKERAIQALRRAVNRRTRAAGIAWHKVSGHWCSWRDQGDQHCDHDYEPVTTFADQDEVLLLNPGGRLVCKRCGKKRWYRGEHGRGTPELGMIETDYRLTANQHTPHPARQDDGEREREKETSS